MAMQPAKVVEADGRKLWRCPSCNRLLGEIVGDRVVVKVADRCFSMAVRTRPDQVCPKCSTISALEAM